MKKVTVLASLMFAVSVLAADSAPETPYGLANKDALAAVDRYTTAKDKAAESYQKEIRQARDKLITSLTAVMTQLTKAGDLDQAIKVRDALVTIKAETPAPPTEDSSRTRQVLQDRLSMLRRMHGTVWRNVTKTDETQTYNSEDMTVQSSWHGAVGTWAPLGKDMCRISGSMNGCGGVVARLSADGTQMFLYQNDRWELIYRLDK